MKECQLCRMIENRKLPDVPIWDSIFTAEYFDVTHAFNTALPGWTVIVLKRHVPAIDQLTDEESIELGMLIHKVSKALKHAVGCVKTYVMQFAEKETHVHFHIVPRMADLEEENKGPNVFNYMDVEPGDSVPEGVRNEIAKKMREAFAT